MTKTPNHAIPARRQVEAKTQDLRGDLRGAISILESAPNRDNRKLTKLYRALQYLLKVEAAITAGYPTVRPSKSNADQSTQEPSDESK